MSKIFFIADPHFGHRNILKYRPEFKSVKEHDDTIIANWNSVVTKDRYIVWVLGDMFMKNPTYDMGVLMQRLNGNIRVITGNHDYMPYFHTEMLWPGMFKKYGFWLSHAPIHPEELRGKCNIHGHVHSRTLDDRRYINVSCEAVNYTPISLDQIRQRKEEEKC